MTKHDEDGIDYLSRQCWWSETLMVGWSSTVECSTIFFYFVMNGYIVLQANLSKLRCYIFMEYKGNWPKNYDTSIIQRANITQKYFSQCVQVWVLSTLQNWKKLLLRPIVKLCWVRLAMLVIHKEKIQHIVSLPFAWWQWPPERGIVGSALRRWRWNQTLLPRHLQGKATES